MLVITNYIQLVRTPYSPKSGYLNDFCCFRRLISSHGPYTQLQTGKFFYIYICCFIAKSRGMSLTHVKSAIRIRIFTFYLFKAEQYTSGRVQNVGCVYYCCCSLYLEIKVGCVRLRLMSSNCQTLNPHIRQMRGFW